MLSAAFAVLALKRDFQPLSGNSQTQPNTARGYYSDCIAARKITDMSKGGQNRGVDRFVAKPVFGGKSRLKSAIPKSNTPAEKAAKTAPERRNPEIDLVKH